MKIEGSKGPQQIGKKSSPRKASATSSGAGLFLDRLTDTSPSSRGDVEGLSELNEMSTVQSVVSPEALMGLQSVDATNDSLDRQANRRGYQWGLDSLDVLDKLRHAILNGQLDETTLRELADNLENSVDQVIEPNLKMVLFDIELRARVELAKFAKTR